MSECSRQMVGQTERQAGSQREEVKSTLKMFDPCIELEKSGIHIHTYTHSQPLTEKTKDQPLKWF